MKKKLIVCSLIFFVGFLYANEKSVWVTKEDINPKEYNEPIKPHNKRRRIKV